MWLELQIYGQWCRGDFSYIKYSSNFKNLRIYDVEIHGIIYCGDNIMKQFLKENIIDMIVAYILSVLIMAVAGYFLKLDFLSLFLVVTVINAINFITEFIKYSKARR